jgi:hypothetical protein
MKRSKRKNCKNEKRKIKERKKEGKILERKIKEEVVVLVRRKRESFIYYDK